MEFGEASNFEEYRPAPLACSRLKDKRFSIEIPSTAVGCGLGARAETLTTGLD
jgi:hypothetical protein